MRKMPMRQFLLENGVLSDMLGKVILNSQVYYWNGCHLYDVLEEFLESACIHKKNNGEENV